MASLRRAYRLSANLTNQTIGRAVGVRRLRTSTRALAAQNLTMPALSPTMTEGNIMKWRVQEGGKFAAGDVLLEIETDKATMDVEAQEDGILMKIMQRDGSKAVQVGARIAVIADDGDDISTLELPVDENSQKSTSQNNMKTDQSGSPPPAHSSREDRSQAKSASPPTRHDGASNTAHGQAPNRKLPFLPSVAHLLKQNGVDDSSIGDMIATGPNARLLKGDVLAFLGKIDRRIPSDILARVQRDSHLDLRNIKLAKAPAEIAKPKSVDAPTLVPPSKTDARPLSEVSLSISFGAALHLQKRAQSLLGVSLPLDTLIKRALKLVNQEMPAIVVDARSLGDRLFDEILGLDAAQTKSSQRILSSRTYTPIITRVDTRAPPPQKRQLLESYDVIDILSGTVCKATSPPAQIAPAIDQTAECGLFSLDVPQEEAKNAQLFLARVKSVLETEPSRLLTSS